MFRFRYILAAMLALAVLAAACGGGNGSDPTATPDETVLGSGDDGDATAEPTDDSGDDGDDNGGSGGSSDDARDAARRFADSTFRAVYRLTPGSADDASFGEGTMTMYKDGRDRIRIDISSVQDGQEFSAIIIDSPEASGFCLEDAGELGAIFGIEGDEGVCFANDPTGGAGFGDLTSEFDELENEDFDVTNTTQREIAGVDATCFDTVEEGETSNVCVSDDGVLLAVGTPGDGFELEATEVSEDVSDGDFELPYEIRELPGLPGAEE